MKLPLQIFRLLWGKSYWKNKSVRYFLVTRYISIKKIIGVYSYTFSMSPTFWLPSLFPPARSNFFGTYPRWVLWSVTYQITSFLTLNQIKIDISLSITVIFDEISGLRLFLGSGYYSLPIIMKSVFHCVPTVVIKWPSVQWWLPTWWGLRCISGETISDNSDTSCISE